MEFKDAYFLLANNLPKYKGKIAGHKKTLATYKIDSIYIGLENPGAKDLESIKKRQHALGSSIDPKLYSLLKNQPCRLYARLFNEVYETIEDVPLDKVKEEYHLKS